LLPVLEKTDFEQKGTVEYYYQKLMRYKEIKHTTIERYYSIYENHIKQFSNYAADEIKISMVREWAKTLNLSPKSIRMAINVFSQIMNEAILDEAIEKNPLKTVKPPKLTKYKPQPFSDKEMQLLLNNSMGYFRNILGFLFNTGMRIGEVLALDWRDIQKDFIVVEKTIRKGVIGTVKTDNVRRIPIFNALRPFIEAQRFISSGQRVFPNTKGADSLAKQWQALLKHCGMENRVLYQTRHTFAIKALDSGRLKASQIAYILGHTSLRMLFDKYAEFIKSETEEADISFSVLDTKLDTMCV
jgi:integrase